MHFLDLIKQRFSVRAYLATPVEDAKLHAVLEAGRLAPSAANRQPWSVIVVASEGQRRAVAEAYPRDWFARAPVILVVCIEPARAWVRADGHNYADVDGAIAMDHMTLCAAEAGLGTCWIGAFDTARLKLALRLPQGIEPLAMTPLGYPDDLVRAKSRKQMGELVHREVW